MRASARFPLHQAGRPVLETLLHGRQLAERLGQIVLHGRPLTVTQPFFSEDIARAAFQEFIASGGKKEPCAELTSHEREVLVSIAEGQSNKEIATKLGIGVCTIETHRERIMRRLHIHSVADLTECAIANGLISLEGGPEGTRHPASAR